MNRKSLNHNMDGEEKDATKSRPSPADFPLGSLQSRVAARIMQEEKALHTSEQERRKQIDAACATWIISHTQGPMYWLRNWTKTENYQWRDQGLNPVAPFPYKPWPKGERHIDFAAFPFKHDLTEDDPPDYLDVVMGYMLWSKNLNIPKTREMMTSWLVVGFITWFCQFFEKVGWVGQSEDDLKAQGLIKYANILYSNQEQWMKDLHPLKRRKDEGTLHRIEWENGSWFLAIPSGVRKLASLHPHGYFNDESAHQPAWKETVNIVRPAVRQIINVSSVAPGDFADECLLVR
jgi:hypothetical protein